MKKLGNLICTLLLLGAINLNAKVIFDLQDQYLESAYNGKYNAVAYELKDSIVSTVNLAQSKSTGRYVTTPKGTGSIVIKPKKSLKNFGVSVQGLYRSTDKGHTSSISIKSDNGSDYVISFSYKKIVVNNKVFTVQNYYTESMHTNIKKTNDTIICTINGKEFLKQEIKGFGKLKRVEHTISSYKDGYSRYDSILGISIIGE